MLSADQIAAGYILPCSAKPLTDCVVEVKCVHEGAPREGGWHAVPGRASSASRACTRARACAGAHLRSPRRSRAHPPNPRRSNDWGVHVIENWKHTARA